MIQSGELLRVADICKSYAGPVLSNVPFTLHRGEVHALVGENGAGKSTLARIIAGLTKADSGTMTLRGQPYTPRDKKGAERHGVRIVMQELNLIANLSVAESVFLGRLPHRFGWIDRRRLDEQAREVLQRVGLADLDPRRLVKSLGVGQQQLVEVAAGLAQRCDVLILDEPSAALTDPEIERLFEQILRLKGAGAGIVYISHRLEEVQRISDRISVLRDGQMIATRPTSEVSLDEVVRLMVGRELSQAIHRAPKPAGPVALRVSGLRRGAAVKDVSFEVRRGEILGFAGLMGSGRTETMRAVFGADRRDAGQVFLHGATEPAPIDSPRDAVRHGLALLTENRKEEGLLLPLPVRPNITLTCLGRFRHAGGWFRAMPERAEAARWSNRLGVRCGSVEQRVVELSGGNQQKVVIAKWLIRDCDLLIFDEPTRGIDVGAKFDVYQLLTDLADQGKAIILVSSDLKELLALCDRIAVMSAGRLAATFNRGEWSQDGIMAAALSGYLKEK
ncbi:MAG: sugar ABC transporter ATP-binding protein [Verrucomicrobia bacterium]|nr:sugar ABC transporter ATP-binding protein [Verrucomicrobiota bacterium]